MRFMENIDSSASGTSAEGINSTPSPAAHVAQLSPSRSLDDSYDHLSPSDIDPVAASGSNSSHPSAASMTDAASGIPGSVDRKARLLYCKSHVAIHPTNFSRDNISGYLGIVELDKDGTGNNVDNEGNVKGEGRKEVLITWVPDEVLQRMDEQDREGYKKIEQRGEASVPSEEDGFVFVSIPPPRGEKYAFSVPISTIYSVLVYPPSLSHWYGSATFNLTGGVSLPTLYFHDDESPLLASTPTIGQIPNPRSQWGFPPFVNLLQSRSTLLRSGLITPRQNHGAELWLVNPSKSDREVHEAGYDEPTPLRPPPPATSSSSTADRRSPSVGTGRSSNERRRSSIPVGLFGAAIVPNYPNYPPEPQFPNSPMVGGSPKQSLLMGLSNITNIARKAAKEVINSPIAQPVVPHLPPAMRSLVNAQGEWNSAGAPGASRGRGKNQRASDVASEFESARLYLARWARVVAEEGERARRQEVAAARRSGGVGGSEGEIDSENTGLGVFSLLSSPNSSKPPPAHTRRPHDPITARDWESFAAQGRDELFVRKEIFRRGFSSSTEPEETRARREGWEVLLGTIPWSLGGLGGGDVGKAERVAKRAETRYAKRAEYDKLKQNWLDVVRDLKPVQPVAGGDEVMTAAQQQEGERRAVRNEEAEGWKEEWHRIDVDCRRTDRNQKIYAVPASAKDKGDEEKEGGGVPSSNAFGFGKEEEEGSAAALNLHIAALRMILMTYHTYSPELGYVQGMSDLLSPIYVVFDANEADAFWGLVGVMQMMESNFLRDQSGMKRQLSILQRLIGVMDPELYAHLERTDSLNLFFCFRWILISFKREFAFDQVIRLWEVLWTNYYSNHFNLFVALAILQSHRDVLIRYLTEFDEVLKYANDLSGTIDLDTTLAQAEVLFLSFRSLVEDLNRDITLTAGTSLTDSSSAPGAGTANGSTDAAAGPSRLSAPTGPDAVGLGVRKRRGSGISVKSNKGELVRTGEIAALRGLVKGWGEEVKEEEDLEVVLGDRLGKMRL